MSGPALPTECDRILVDEEHIRERVAQMGAQIAEDFADTEDVRFITVLKGGLFFVADLARATSLPLSVDFMAVTPYAVGAGGTVRVTKDLSDGIAGASVVLVEDIVDTGLTVNYVLSLLRGHDPAQLAVCTLLDKPARRIADVPIDYTGFTLPDRFVVGYGLDLDGRYRNLRYIASVRDEEVLS